MTEVVDKASRVNVRRWRDPRLWVGVFLVVAAVVAGARLLADAGDTVAVWALAHDVPSGGSIGPDDLRATRVHFDDRNTESAYYPASTRLPPGLRAVHDLGSGQLLGLTAVSSDAAATVEVPLSVDDAGFPAGLAAGDHVDVWAVRDRTSRSSPARSGSTFSSSSLSSSGLSSSGRSTVVASDVVVRATGDESAVGGRHQVLVGMPSDHDSVGRMLDALHGADVVLVRHGR